MARRGRGGGGWTKRANGTIQVYVEVGPPDPQTKRRDREYRTAYSPKEAEEVLDALRKEYQGVTAAPNFRRCTVREYLERWLEDGCPSVKYQGKPKAGKTLEQYRRVVADVVAILGNHGLQKLTAVDIRSLVARLQKAGRSVDVVHDIWTVFGVAINKAIEEGVLVNDPRKGVRCPQPPKKTMEFWEADEAMRFIAYAHAQGDRFAALYDVAILGGLRQGELLGLQWQDINLKAGTLRVQRQIQELELKAGDERADGSRQERDGEGLACRPPKYNGLRTIELGADLVQALRQHLERQVAEGLAGCKWVFPGRRGGPSWPHNFESRSWCRLLYGSADNADGARKAVAEARRAGRPEAEVSRVGGAVGLGLVKDIRFHDLRHTAATMLLASGVDTVTGAARLGHDSVTFARTYSHVTSSMSKAAAARVEAYLKASAE